MDRQAAGEYAHALKAFFYAGMIAGSLVSEEELDLATDYVKEATEAISAIRAIRKKRKDDPSN